MSETDKTKDVLEQLLARLYSEQAQQLRTVGPSHLVAADGQMLGKITENQFDHESILNEYGPYSMGVLMAHTASTIRTQLILQNWSLAVARSA
jgi:hypothetical protein